MSKPITKKYQKCDFCGQELEIEVELPWVKLPCKFLDGDGSCSKTFVNASICPQCYCKLYNHLETRLELKEIAYGGAIVKWKN